ncbi:energy transducer TonB [Azospirillum halopraeferens]|uniref:energy transducer TonB n=1 Tax=Azospirillum halopraeferens TaxID=34010 RepID=UPI000405C4FB|nr:energy transducer TonB [Azospirillum halopraeferens]
MTRPPRPAPAGAEHRPVRTALRWSASLAAVLTAHVGGAAALLAWQAPPPPEPPMAAVMIDLAPLPSAPAVESAPSEPSPPVEQPPEPEPPPPEPEPEPPPPEPEPEPEPEPPPPEPEPEPEPPPPEVKPEVVLEQTPPPPPPKPKPPKPVRQEPEKPRPPRQAPPPPPAPAAPAAPMAPAATAAAPMQSAPSNRPSQALPQWRDRLLGHLERHKRYPRAAQMRRQEGVAYVRFTIDRQGTVLSVRLDRTSGHGLLDDETIALVERASPLPAPPQDVGQDRVELVVPVQFYLR